MYLVIIRVPIFRDGSSALLASDWLRAVGLLRDSFNGRFGDLHVLAPSMPASAAPSDVVLEPVDGRLDGVHLHPSIDQRVRTWSYWTGQRKKWLADARRLVAQADVVHGGFADPIRPLMYDGLKVAFRKDCPTVVFRDTDTLLQLAAQRAGASARRRLELAIRATLFARMARRVAKSVDLLMLKGQSLMRWLGPHARNARLFHNTSYLQSEMAPAEAMEARIAGAAAGRRLRLVYCGRLVDRKGVDDSLKLIHAASQRGAEYTFDVIGDGPERASLEQITQSLGLASQVNFLGWIPYNAQLIARLAEYDAVLFTPKFEDTPRMIFDGYAAGLPLLGTGIPYVLERAEEDKACAVLPVGDEAAAVDQLVDLWYRREKLSDLAQAARKAGQYHAADRWYARRADWTIEAVERHGSSNGS